MNEFYVITPTYGDLQHHGILGMKWGVRRYQNKDGTLTAAGKRRLKTFTKAAEVANKKAESDINTANDYNKRTIDFQNEYSGEKGLERYMDDMFGKDWHDEKYMKENFELYGMKDYKALLKSDLAGVKTYNNSMYQSYMKSANEWLTKSNKYLQTPISELTRKDYKEAKKLANEIISKLNNGTSWDDVISEYKDQIVSEELGYNAFNASLESAYLKECKDLAVGTYSKTPVLTSYGYHIVYKIAQKDKPELDEVKDDIKEILADKKKDADTNLYYKSLIKMREDAGLEFSDTKLADEYKKYMNQYK